MQENEFDKQVKGAMDEFRLRPSEPVWPAIYDEIKDKKRRRILLLLPLFIGLMALGYFTWNDFYRSPKKYSLQKEPDTNTKTTANKAKTNNGQSPSQDAVTSAKESQPDKPSTTTPENENSTTRNDIANKNISPETGGHFTTNSQLKLAKTDKRNINQRRAGSKHKIPTHENNELLLSSPQLSERNKLTEVKKIEGNEDNTFDTQNNVQPDNTPVMTESDSPFLTTNSIKDGKVALKSPAKIAGIINNRKIRWGVDLAFGGSSRADQPFNGGATEKSGPLAAGYQGAGGALGNVAGGLLVLPPSDVKPGIGFKIGIVADKSISRRLRVSAGLRYAFLSEHITIGKTIYPTVNRVTLQGLSYSTNAVAQTAYAGMQTQDFTNKYHFIELPVTGYLTITPKWRTPLVWDAGASVSRLISSNALLYDKAWGGVYYKGQNNLSKTLFGVSTGFSVRFKGNNQWLWSVGPRFSMNTTKLFQSTSDKNKHIVYGSMNLQLLFPGKKK